MLIITGLKKMKKFYVILMFSLILGVVCFLGAQETERFTLNVFFTNDVHGGIVPQSADFLNPEFPPMLGGGASAMAIVKQARQEIEKAGGASLFIDSGDIFQGTLVGTLSEGQAIIEYMNLAGYDACVPGNHDFDLGAENLVELIKMSEFAWVSCNILDEETGEIWSPLKPYIVKTINGVKIGITGATTVGTEYMSFPENIKGLKFVSEIEALRKAVQQLRNDEKVDLVVALVHTGLPYDRQEGFEELQNTTEEDIKKTGYANAMEIAHFVEGIDLLLGGHLHRGYQEPWVDPGNHTICIQNYGNGGNLGWIKLQIDEGSKAIMGYDYPSDEGTLLLLQQDEFWPDSAIAAYISAQQEIYEKGFEEIIGTTQTALTRTGVGEAPMYNLVTDAMKERVNADFSFTNYGGVRADLKAGPVTREDIFKVLPFGNQIVRFKASGGFLKQIIERKVRGNGRGMAISGGKIEYNNTRPDGDKITSFTINGEPLKADKTYLVATTDYLMEGNSGLSMLLDVPRESVAYTGVLLREAVIEYIKDHSPLNIEIEGRWDKDEDAQPDPEWIKQFKQENQAVLEE
jgi:2',3'-cyclic-nucleotide 2'-phosphodiesterase (5'-nucleotidase family)